MAQAGHTSVPRAVRPAPFRGRSFDQTFWSHDIPRQDDVIANVARLAQNLLTGWGEGTASRGGSGRAPRDRRPRPARRGTGAHSRPPPQAGGWARVAERAASRRPTTTT